MSFDHNNTKEGISRAATPLPRPPSFVLRPSLFSLRSFVLHCFFSLVFHPSRSLTHLFPFVPSSYTFFSLVFHPSLPLSHLFPFVAIIHFSPLSLSFSLYLLSFILVTHSLVSGRGVSWSSFLPSANSWRTVVEALHILTHTLARGTGEGR